MIRMVIKISVKDDTRFRKRGKKKEKEQKNKKNQKQKKKNPCLKH